MPLHWVDQMPEGEGFDPFFVPDDWARLQYGRLVWRNPKMRERLLRHWMDSRHPSKDRFVSRYRGEVERLLSSRPDEDKELDREFRERGLTLRTVMREIPPVYGSFFGESVSLSRDGR